MIGGKISQIGKLNIENNIIENKSIKKNNIKDFLTNHADSTACITGGITTKKKEHETAEKYNISHNIENSSYLTSYASGNGRYSCWLEVSEKSKFKNNEANKKKRH